MPELRRRLLTIYPPLYVGVMVGVQQAVEQMYPGAVIDWSGVSGEEFHIVITETVEDDDPRLISVPGAPV